MKKRRRLVPLSVVLQDECLVDLARYADVFYLE